MNSVVGRSLLQRVMCWSLLLFVATGSAKCRTIGGETPQGAWLRPGARNSAHFKASGHAIMSVLCSAMRAVRSPPSSLTSETKSAGTLCMMTG